eukprot:g18052.t1
MEVVFHDLGDCVGPDCDAVRQVAAAVAASTASGEGPWRNGIFGIGVSGGSGGGGPPDGNSSSSLWSLSEGRGRSGSASSSPGTRSLQALMQRLTSASASRSRMNVRREKSTSSSSNDTGGNITSTFASTGVEDVDCRVEPWTIDWPNCFYEEPHYLHCSYTTFFNETGSALIPHNHSEGSLDQTFLLSMVDFAGGADCDAFAAGLIAHAWLHHETDPDADVWGSGGSGNTTTSTTPFPFPVFAAVDCGSGPSTNATNATNDTDATNATNATNITSLLAASTTSAATTPSYTLPEVPICEECGPNLHECWETCGGGSGPDAPARGLCDKCNSAAGSRGACCNQGDTNDPADCENAVEYPTDAGNWHVLPRS